MELKNKKVNFLGDSITEGVGVSDIANNRYDNRLKKKYSLDTANYGISGTRISYNPVPTATYPTWDLYFPGRVLTMRQGADITVVFGGTNDYGHGFAPFGELSDTSANTFCGAVRTLIAEFKKIHPHTRLVFLTPASRATQEHCAFNAPDKRSFEDYVDAIKVICKENGVAVFDMLRDLGIDNTDPEQRAKYTVDGLHFNDEGHRIIAEKLAEFIESL